MLPGLIWMGHKRLFNGSWPEKNMLLAKWSAFQMSFLLFGDQFNEIPICAVLVFSNGINVNLV